MGNQRDFCGGQYRCSKVFQPGKRNRIRFLPPSLIKSNPPQRPENSSMFIPFDDQQSGDQPWHWFVTRYSRRPEVRWDFLHALPRQLVEIIAAEVTGFWTKYDLEFERELSDK